MAEHNVFLSSTANLQLTNKNLEFQLKQGNRQLGYLLISKGGLEWRPRYGRDPIGMS